MKKILILQTAFLGDVILTLPLAQSLRRAYPDAVIDMVVLPSAANVVEGSPAVTAALIFDKKGGQRGIRPLLRFGLELRARRYDLVISPHRSLRTAVLVLFSGARRRIGFRTSALTLVFTDLVDRPMSEHEVDRTLGLLRPLGIEPFRKEKPQIVPDDGDKERVDRFLRDAALEDSNFLTIAPGSVWLTKRWPVARYAGLVRALESQGMACVLIGGPEDDELARHILLEAGARRSVHAAGRLSIRQSAEIIRRSRLLITNDTAPLHLGVSMHTRVVALFGPTVPSFGFAPYGMDDIVIEREGLTCRPCTKHGGPACPIGTFECMESITVQEVMDRLPRD